MEIIKSMIKEEWRIHSSMFGNFMFALFPFLIVLFALIGSLSLTFIREIFPISQVALAVQYTFLFFGISVGSFGLMGREFMNRRFGHASLIAYSSRNLPISEMRIFANFIIKDIIYYFFLWIIPFWAGFTLSLPIMGASISYSLPFLASSTFSFLIGMSASFFLSTVFINSRKLFAIMVASLMMIIFFSASIGIGPDSLPSLTLFNNMSYANLLACLALSIVPSVISIFFVKADFPHRKKRYGNWIVPLSDFMKPLGNENFIAKDFIDLWRSEGGIGKIIFSFFFPLLIIWIVLMIFTRFVPGISSLTIFGIFLGVISSTVYNWLTEFDIFTSYSFLPVRVSEVMRSKIKSYVIINAISVIILLAAAVLTAQLEYFIPSLISVITISAYSLSVLIYLSGLYPNIMLYNAKIFLQYILMNCPILLFSIFLSILNPYYTILTVVLIPISILLAGKGFKKWDSWEHPSF